MLSPFKLSSPPTNGFWEVPVLFEDDDLLALDRPLDLPVRSESPDQPCLLQLLEAGIKAGARWATDRNLVHLSLALRADADSSGVVLFARSSAIFANLANQFGSSLPNRRYTALVQGQPQQDQFDANAPLAPHPTRRGSLVVSPGRGKKTVTRFQVRERFTRHALLHCEPVTNRHGQIPVHLRWVRLPLVADRANGGSLLLLSRLKQGYRLKPDQTERPLLSRPALHLDRVTITHPRTGAPLAIEAPLPKDLQVALKYLRRYAA